MDKQYSKAEGGSADRIFGLVKSLHQPELFRNLNWLGSFQDYLELVDREPRVTRNAFRRLYDMILSHGSEEYVEFKKRITHYHFFEDEGTMEDVISRLNELFEDEGRPCG